jgi:opacity protein-like surface antigen
LSLPDWRFCWIDRIIPSHLAMVRMNIFSSKAALALALAALALGPRTAHAQAAPLSYWIPGGPFGFGGNENAGAGANTYGDFPAFDGGGASDARANVPNGWFVGGEAGGHGLGFNGIDQSAAFGLPSLSYQGVQFGYNTKTASGLPVSVYAGFDTLKYDTGGIGSFAAFDSASSNTLPGYSMRAGVAFQPTSNISLSLGVGYTQQPGYAVNSLLPAGTAPTAFGGR